MNKIITVNGRRWFERVNGNTYHSVVVHVDGDCIGKVDFTYGYGSHYEQTALELLVKAGVYPNDNKSFRSLWRTVEDAGDKLVNSVTDVSRKRDL